jgi:MFS family permease
VIFASSAKVAAVSFSPATIETLAFAGMALGGPGCIWAGSASDRAAASDASARIRQRANVTIICMVASGLSCVLTAVFFSNIYVVIAVAIVWGLSISADSAQFSAIISEVSDPRYVGTALTFQTAVGFLLTVFSIRTTALIAERYGWNVAAASLAIGPVLGIVAMVRLKQEVRD